MLEPYERFFILRNEDHSYRKVYNALGHARNACFKMNGMAKLKNKSEVYTVDEIVRWRRSYDRVVESSVIYA